VTGAQDLPLLGGDLCLDFANTVEFRDTPRAQDWLESYGELLAWAAHAGVLERATARRLGAVAAKHPAAARAALKRAVAFREALYGIASALAGGRPVPEAALAVIKRQLFGRPGQTRLVAAGRRLARRWAGKPDALDQVIWPIAWAAHDLLTGAAAAQLRVCANDECHWLFLDKSRNHSRRWCAMEICGNLVKARRHRRRKS